MTSTPTALVGKPAPPKKIASAQAVIQIIIADVSMSLDNVLAVAGAAHAASSKSWSSASSCRSILMGARLDLYRAAPPEASLDRLGRPCHHSLRGRQAWSTRALIN